MRYLTNRLTNFDEVWHSEASQSSGLHKPRKFQNLKVHFRVLTTLENLEISGNLLILENSGI